MMKQAGFSRSLKRPAIWNGFLFWLFFLSQPIESRFHIIFSLFIILFKYNLQDGQDVQDKNYY